MTPAVALHEYLVRRYPDPRDLRQLVELHLGAEIGSALPVEVHAQRLAFVLLQHCEHRGQTLDLFAALQHDAGGRGEELARVVADYLAAHPDPSLRRAIDRYAEHARLTARRPPLEQQVGKFLDGADHDLDRVWISLTSRPVPAPQLQPPTDAQGPKPLPVLEVAAPVLELWPARAPWLLLLGDPGAGKSVVARRALIEQLEAGGRTPVRVELGRYAAWTTRATGPHSFLRFLGETFATTGVPLSATQLRGLALAGEVTWIVDGLDEVANAELRSHCVEQLIHLRDRGPVLVTSRPRGVTPARETLREAGFAIHELVPLDDPMLAKLGNNWFGAGLIDAAALQRALGTAAVREQMRSPLIATFVLVLARRGMPLQQRHAVLSQICALTVRTWADRRGPLSLDARARMAFLRGLAWTMLTAPGQGAENIVEHAALHRFAASFFREREPGLSRDEAVARAESLIAELNEEVHAISPLGGASFGFVHRSLLEFFAADALAESQDPDVVARFAADWHHSTWTEVLPMACGLIAESRPALAVRALRAVVAGGPSLAAARLLAASEFVVRCFAEVEPIGPDLAALADALSEAWISLASLGELDMRGLAAVLRPIGPRWPGARRLGEWFEATGGSGRLLGIPEFNVQLSHGSSTQVSLVHAVIAVTAVASRPRLLARLLARSPAVLMPFADGLASMGPWTDGELEQLIRSLDRFGWAWDAQVVAWLGDLAGTAAEPELALRMLDEGRDSLERMFTAALLISSSTMRSEAISALDGEISAIAARQPSVILQEINAQIVATALRLEPTAAVDLCRRLMALGAPEPRATACLLAAHFGDEEAAAALVTMLRSQDRRTHDAANWALTHGRLRDGIDRVLASLGDDIGCVTLAWAAMTLPPVAEQHGRWAAARALWCHLADAGEWSGQLRWMAVAALISRPTWRDAGIERLLRLQPDTPPNSPNIDTALRRLGEYPDGPEHLRRLLAAEPGRVRRRWIAQALLERDPDDLAARDELRAQADSSGDRQEQHLLAHAMRRLGLPRADWEAVARKIAGHGDDPISRCAVAVLLADVEALRSLDAELAARTDDPRRPSIDPDVRELAGLLLRVEDLRLRLAGG